jgi:hypothetical protein
LLSRAKDAYGVTASGQRLGDVAEETTGRSDVGRVELIQDE